MTNVVDLNVNRAVDASGNYLAGAKAYFYQSGTSTPVTVYADAAATTPHATPVVADGSGVFPAIYAAGSVALKVNVTTSSGSAVPGYPRDPVVIFSDTSTGASAINFSPITGNGALNVQAAIANIQPTINSISDFAKTYLDETTAAATLAVLGVGANFGNVPTQITDWNVASSGFFWGDAAAANSPGAFVSAGFTAWVSSATAVQFAVHSGGNEMYYRRLSTSVWTSWVRVIDTANLAANLNASGSAPIYACRAWVNFKGTGTVSIRASGNVSSITDNGVGDYTVNFTTAMPDANYAVLRSIDADSAGNGVVTCNTEVLSATTTSVRVTSETSSGTRSDADRFEIAIFR